MKILIIANARIKGGLSGGDNIYLNFVRYWPVGVRVDSMMETDYKPFLICYIHRIIAGCWNAFLDCWCYKTTPDIVFSASDFWMDLFPGLIYKIAGKKWVASFYLEAPKENKMYRLSQWIAKPLIKRFADVVCVTNDSMKPLFPCKKTVSVHGGVDLSLAGHDDRPRIYDAVFVGRIHATKGIDELMQIWRVVVDYKPNAKLVIIGDGDLGLDYLCNSIKMLGLQKNIELKGYMGPERFSVYKESKMVLYPTPTKYDHFSMAPVEAMACGCPLVAFHTPVMDVIKPEGALLANDCRLFVSYIIRLRHDEKINSDGYVSLQMKAYKWAQQWDWEKRAKTVYQGVYHEFSLRR